MDDEPQMDPSQVSAQLDQLASLDNCDASEESIAIIRSSLPLSTLQLDASQSQAFIDALDKAAVTVRADTELYQKCLRALRKVCGARGLLPSSYLLSEGLTKKTDWPAARGGFADVWEGTYGSRLVAIKSVRLYANLRLTEIRKTFYKEVVIWKQLSHPNVVPFLGVSESLSPLCMISEWMPHGNITEYVNANPDADRLRLLVDVCKGLQYLHILNIVHRDLKGANILISPSQQACLSDFGLTSVVSDLTTMNASTSFSLSRGTCRWMAPELLDGETEAAGGLYSTASDIYALGMVSLEVLSGKVPFRELPNDASVIFRVMQKERPQRAEELLKVGLSDEVWMLVQLCWHHERDMRPKISFVLNRLRAATPSISIIEGLEGFDPASEVSIDVLRSALESSVEKVFSADLTHENYVTLIDILDRSIESTQVDRDLRRRCVSAIAKVYGHTRLIPLSYLLPDVVKQTYEKPVFIGGCTEIWEGTYIDRAVAIKTFKTSRIDDEDVTRRRLFKQAATWKILSDLNIVPFVGISNTVPPSIVSQWMTHGALIDYVRSHSEVNRLQLLVDIGTGLAFLHSQEIVHGDLKAANILVDEDGKARLSGLRSIASEVTSPTPSIFTLSSGSQRWAAPEVLDPESTSLPDNGFSTASDIYSFAMVFVEVFTENVPFSDFSDSMVVLRVMKGKRPDRPENALSLGLTNDIWELMQMCWQQYYDDRPKISSVLEYLQRPAPGLSRRERLGLADFDPADESSIDKIRSVLNTQTDMDILLDCHELDAIMFIDMLDHVIGSKLSDPVLDQKALRTVIKLWDRTLLLPSSYQITGELEKTQETQVESWANHWQMYKGTCDGRDVYIKSYTETEATSLKMFVKDAVFSKRLLHPNILPFLGVSSTLYPFCVVAPWMKNGNIFNYPQANPDVDRLPLMIDIAEGVQYLHSLNIIHGNMKCTNVLINDEGRACISGFEMAVIRNPLAPDEDDPDAFYAGAIEYMAPELLPSKGTTWRSMPTDIYSLAVIMIWIYSDIDPFTGYSADDMMNHILRGGRPERPENSVEVGLTDDLWELARSCWEKDANKRPKIQTVLDQLKKIRDKGPEVPSVEPPSTGLFGPNSPPSSITDIDRSDLISVSRSRKGAKSPSSGRSKGLLSPNSLRSSWTFTSKTDVGNSDQNSENTGTPKKSSSIFARLRR